MLGHSDIHYLVAFLYVVARTTDITVTAGDRVLDKASQSERDVDIVVVTAGGIGLGGIEVKDESRSLDVTVVEALCAKLNDMPSLTTRAIVSASGFTAPARRKAAAHGVVCLTLVQGRIPSFQTVDLSQLAEITLAYADWVRGPEVCLVPANTLTDTERASLSDSTSVAYPLGIATDVNTIKLLVDRIAAQVTCNWFGPETPGEFDARIDVEIEGEPALVLASRMVPVIGAVVTGAVRVTKTVAPLTAASYLAQESGEPFAAAVIVDIRSGLFGLAVAANTNELRAFHIPTALRDKRPFKDVVFPRLARPI